MRKNTFLTDGVAVRIDEDVGTNTGFSFGALDSDITGHQVEYPQCTETKDGDGGTIGNESSRLYESRNGLR